MLAEIRGCCTIGSCDKRRDTRKKHVGALFGGYAQIWTHPQNGQQYEQFVLDKETTLTPPKQRLNGIISTVL